MNLGAVPVNTLLLVFCFPLAASSAVTGSYTPEQILEALNQRNSKAASAAIEFSLQRQSRQGKDSTEGMMAVHEGSFIFRSRNFAGPTPEEAGEPYVYDYSSDGQRFQQLVQNVKSSKRTTKDADRYLERTLSLISRPTDMLISNAFKDESRGLFEADEVIDIRTDSSSGRVIVEIDSMRRSDFDRTVYELSPRDDWALVRADYRSGGITVASVHADRFFTAPGSGLKMAGRLEYIRHVIDDDDTSTISRAVAEIRPSLDFAFDDSGSFLIPFPDSAVDQEMAKVVGRARQIRREDGARDRPSESGGLDTMLAAVMEAQGDSLEDPEEPPPDPAAPEVESAASPPAKTPSPVDPDVVAPPRSPLAAVVITIVAVLIGVAAWRMARRRS